MMGFFFFFVWIGKNLINNFLHLKRKGFLMDAMNFGWGLHVFSTEESSDWSSQGLIVTTKKGFTYHVTIVM
jgi:hypothetical protein